MAIELHWSIEGEQQLARRINEIDARVNNLRPAFGKAVKELKSVFSNEVFETRGRAIGENWPPLSPQYLAQKRKRGYPSQPLVATGKMKASFKTMFDANRGEVWNSVHYFQYHQSNKPRKKLPRRVMMKLGEQQRELVVKIFHELLFK